MDNIFNKHLIILLSLTLILLIFNGCSSGSKTTETKMETSTEENKNEKSIKNNDVNEREHILRLNIKSIDKVQFEYNLKGKVIKSVKLSSTIYNRNGYLSETYIFGEGDSIIYKYVYVYDKSGKRIETKRYLPNGLQDKKYTYEYNEYGNKVKSIRYNLLNEEEKYYLYKYDDEGNLIEDDWYDKSGNLEYKIENDFEDGIKTESRSYGENGDLSFRYIYKYDRYGNIIEETKLDDEGRKAALIQYIYKYY